MLDRKVRVDTKSYVWYGGHGTIERLMGSRKGVHAQPSIATTTANNTLICTSSKGFGNLVLLHAAVVVRCITHPRPSGFRALGTNLTIFVPKHSKETDTVR